MKTAVIPALFALALSLSVPAAADPFDGSGGLKNNYFYKQLDNYVVSKKPVMYIVGRIVDKLEKDPEMLPVAYNWVKTMTEVKHPDQMNGFYFMLRSDLAHRTAKEFATSKDKRNPAYKAAGLDALNSMMTFEMILMTDAARCANPDFNGDIIGMLLGPRYDTLGQYVYSLLIPSDMPGVWEDALQGEVALKGRAPNKELCSNGALIGQMLIDDADKSKIPQQVEPIYVDDATWDNERNKLRYSIRDFWKKRYEERTGKKLK